MDPELKMLLSFVGILFVWVSLPLIPAWITFRITPDQTLGLKGPFEGLTLRTTGAFGAYFVVLAVISLFVLNVGTMVVGRMGKDATWTVSGKVSMYDYDGARLESSFPATDKAEVRLLPPLNLVTSDSVVLRLPFRDYEKPKIYLDVPGWGGGTIDLDDTSDYDEDRLTRVITLKEPIVLRQQYPTASSIGPPAGGE